MKLINFDGLHCFYNSISSLAKHWDLKYVDLYAGLLTETDFDFSMFSRRYTSKQFLENLEGIGAHFERLSFADTGLNREILADAKPGTFFIPGVDAYYTPWNPNYRIFSGAHYFIAVKHSASVAGKKNGLRPADNRRGTDAGAACAKKEFTCFDPTYHVQDALIGETYLADHTINLTILRKLPPISSAATGGKAVTEAEFPDFLTIIAERKDYEDMARYLDCMVTNRKLYAHYLKVRRKKYLDDLDLFTPEYFAGWENAKNGMFKAAAAKSESVFRETLKLTGELLAQERQRLFP